MVICEHIDTTRWLTQAFVVTFGFYVCVRARVESSATADMQPAASSIQTSSLGKTNLGSEMTQAGEINSSSS